MGSEKRGAQRAQMKNLARRSGGSAGAVVASDGYKKPPGVLTRGRLEEKGARRDQALAQNPKSAYVLKNPACSGAAVGMATGR